MVATRTGKTRSPREELQASERPRPGPEPPDAALKIADADDATADTPAATTARSGQGNAFIESRRWDKLLIALAAGCNAGGKKHR
jgi:hypothetical protein